MAFGQQFQNCFDMGTQRKKQQRAAKRVVAKNYQEREVTSRIYGDSTEKEEVFKIF